MACRKAALHNLGCKVNSYELEAVSQLLEKSGFEIVPFEPGADLYVINTCTVTAIADRKSRQMLHKAKKMNPGAIVAAMGCYAQVNGSELKKDPAIDIVIGNNQRLELLRLIAQFEESGTKQEARININQTKRFEPLSIDKTADHTRAFIKVQDGCNQFCTYCMIPYARGRVRSRDPEEVADEVRRLAQSGTKEVVITGIHVCSYGQDLGEEIDLLYLLRKIDAIPGISRVRLGSLEPTVITEETAQGMAALEKLCPHFHLSLQSGCDATLQRMNRGYSAEEYRQICDLLRKYFDEPAITTDIITGFPGETEEEFGITRAFVDEISFFETHIFPYSKRKGTRAASFPDQVPEQIKKERSAVLREMSSRKKAVWLEKFVGTETDILLEETVEKDGKVFWLGHTARYQEALILAEESPGAGRIVRAEVRGVSEGAYLLCRRLAILE